MTKRYSLIIIILLAASMRMVAEPIDSLYKKVMSGGSINYKDANELMLRLDALGMTDSLYSYTSNTPENEMRIALALNVGYYYCENARYSAAAKECKLALEIARKENDSVSMVNALSTIGVCYVRQGRYDEASDAMHEELRIDSLRKDYSNMSSVYNNIAGLLVSAGRTPEAKKYILKAIKIEKSLEGTQRLSVRYGMAAEIYNKLGDTKTALDYATKAYELDRKSGDSVKTARRLSQMADIRSAMGDDEEAEVLYIKSVQLLEQAGEKMSWTINMKQLGRLLIKQGRYEEAIAYLKKGEEEARELGNLMILQQICENLATAYRSIDCARAYDYLAESAAMKDSINSERLQQQISNSQAEYDAEECAETISEQAQIIRKQQLVLASLGAVIIALVLLLYKSRKKTADVTVNPIENEGVEEQSIAKPVEKVLEHSEEEDSSDGEVGQAEKPDGTGLKAYEIEFLDKVDNLIEQNIHKSDFTADVLASDMLMSRSQIDRRLKALRGKGASACIQDCRMERAHSLIMETDKTIMEVAYSCGFEDASYFARVFRQYFNASPSQLRKETP